MKIVFATDLMKSSFYPHKDDIAEAKAMGINWKDALKGDMVACVYAGDKVVALGGNDGDRCWFVMDECIDQMTPAQRLRFRNVIIKHRDEMLTVFPVLWNYVWVGNESHKRFLKSIGAVFQDEFARSPITGELFQLFTITKGG